MNELVLISGGSGFVGTHLIRTFHELNFKVLEVSRKPLGQEGITWDEFFQRSSNAITWIHLAGKAHDVHGTSDVTAYNEVNFELTKRFFDAFCRSEGKVFIFLSSVKAAADTVSGVLYEDAVANPKTPYGISKLKAENYILGHLPEGKKVYILRPCMIHGPGNKGNLNLLFRLVEKGIPWPLASFQNKRSFLSIENLCFVIEKLAMGMVPSGIYQIADDESLSTNELIDLMGETMGWKVKLWHVSRFSVRSMARFGDILRLPLNSHRLQKLTESYVVDNSKIKKALNISLPVDVRSGLKRTIESFNK